MFCSQIKLVTSFITLSYNYYTVDVLQITIVRNFRLFVISDIRVVIIVTCLDLKRTVRFVVDRVDVLECKLSNIKIVRA